MQKRYIFLLLVVCAVRLTAQQDHQYTQFMYNKLMVNPGYAGARGVPSISAIYRSQWVGFAGAPRSQIVSLNTPFLSDRVGLGVTLSHRQLGLSRDILGSIAYAYNLLNKDGNMLRVGIQGSGRNIGIDLSKATPVVANDLSLDNKRVNRFGFNVGTGVYASFQEMFYVGVSVPNILKSSYGLDDFNPTHLDAKNVRHFYGMAGASLQLNDDVALMPAILTKYVKNAPFDADLNLSLSIKDRVIPGLSYRLGGDGGGDSFDLTLMVNATPQLGVGFAYDFPLSQIKDYTTGSFEVSAFYDLRKREVKGKKLDLDNPRFFF